MTTTVYLVCRMSKVIPLGGVVWLGIPKVWKGEHGGAKALEHEENNFAVVPAQVANRVTPTDQPKQVCTLVYKGPLLDVVGSKSRGCFKLNRGKD